MRAGPATDVVLTKVDQGEYQVNLDSEQVRAFLFSLVSATEFHIYAEMNDGSAVASIGVRYDLKATLRGLGFSGGHAMMTVAQYTVGEVPGSRGRLYVRLGDITANQVLLSMGGPGYSPCNDVIIHTSSVRVGDALPFRFDDEEYVLVVSRLRNFSLGGDYGVFSIFARNAWESEKIDQLLNAIEASGLTVLRNGEKLTAAIFAGQLREKVKMSDPKIASVDEFIERAGANSSMGRPYRVEQWDGQVVETAEWLRGLASTLNAPDHKGTERATPATTTVRPE